MAQNIDVSIIPQSYLPEIKVSENDDSLRVIRVSIIDENGEAYTIPSGVTATFAGTKPSGLGFTVPCTIDGSAVQFVMEDTVCNEVGRFPAEIRLINGEARIGTCNVLMSVEPNPHPDDTTDGDREPLVNEITALLQQITEQAEQVAEDAQAVQNAVTLWTNMSAEAETLPAGSEASASYSDGVLSLGIPAGPEGTPGQDGQDGVGIASVALNSDYTLTITLTDGTTYTTTSIRGEQGETGLTPDFTIGTVTTLEPGSQATATITGTDEEPVLNLGIPKGDPGDVSSTGYYPDLYAGGLVTDKGETDVSPYTFRASKALGYREKLNSIVGATVGWNQLADANQGSYTHNGVTYQATNGVYTVSGTATASSYDSITSATQPNHVYYISISGNTDVYIWMLGYGAKKTNTERLIKENSTNNIGLNVASGTTVSNAKVTPQVIDLTQAFGTPIADRAYTLEQSTPGSGIAWLRSYGFLTEDYYEYTQPTLESVRVSGHETVGFNQWDEEWEVGTISTTTGASESATNRIRSKNYIPVIPNETYSLTGVDNGRLVVYDGDKNFVQYIDIFNLRPSLLFTVPSGGAYIRFSPVGTYGTVYNNDICINISDASRNGQYEPYTKHTYPLDPSVTLRGVLKLDANNEIYADGDVYESDGGVSRRYAIVDLGSLVWSPGGTSDANAKRMFADIPNAKASASASSVPNIFCVRYSATTPNATYTKTDGITLETVGSRVLVYDSNYNTASDVASFKASLDGVYLVYELATPTTESADPYTQIQFCDPDGTEAFTDYGVASGDRDVAIPAGHSTFYPEDLKGKLEDIPGIPEAPASNGTYTLKAVRSNSGVTYSWVTE